ncbi:MAG: sigma-70 family RNA polymerase sigma factor [Phycisphaeraceae bacterium]
MTTRQGNQQFATTHWNVVLAAGRPGASRYREALASLCGAYWPPLYAFLRRSGRTAADAEDLTQAFFAHLLDRGSLEVADPQRGRFRSFLLTCLKHFVANEHRAAKRLKRGGAAAVLSLDFKSVESRLSLEPSHEVTPERAFEKGWALTLLDRATKRLREEMTKAGKARLLEVLGPHLSRPQERGQYEEAANLLEMTPGAVRTAVSRLRERLRHFIREEVAQTVEGDEQIDAEIRDLMAALAS